MLIKSTPEPLKKQEKHMSFSNLSKTIALCLGVLLMIFLTGYFVFAAWTDPTTNPPEGNADLPLNTGSGLQVKSGGLILNAGGTAPIGGLAVLGQKVDPVGSVCPSGYIFWDWNGNSIKDNGECQKTPLYVKNDGSVGIGTINPKYPLDVNGSIFWKGYVNTATTSVAYSESTVPKVEYNTWYQNPTGVTAFVTALFSCFPDTVCGIRGYLSPDGSAAVPIYWPVDIQIYTSEEIFTGSITSDLVVPAGWWVKWGQIFGNVPFGTITFQTF